MTLPDGVADVVIVGAGVVGTAIARTLAAYSLDVVLADAACDVGAGTSKANTAILHTGFDAKPGSLEARLLSRGAGLLRRYASAARIPVEPTGALLVAWTPDQVAALPGIEANARRNGYEAIRPLRAGELYAREPALGPGALGGLEIPDESIICPWTTPLAFATEAVGAGVRLLLSTQVTEVTAGDDGGWQLATTRGPVRCRWVVNAAGLGSDTLDRMFGGDGFTVRPRRGELIVFDKLARSLLRSILLPVPAARTRGVLVAPTVYGNVLLGPTAEDVPDRSDTATTAAGLRALLAAGRRAWTAAAARMAVGQLVGEESDPDAPPVDTGEAVGSPVSRLTITIGYGPALFDDRFGLAARKPAALADLPPLPNENLDPDYTGGDLCVQACADNPLVAFHAVRNLARIGMGVVAHNWMELGFGRTSTTSTAQATPRNLLGFKDGTRNIKAEQTDLLNQHVWVGQETDQPWLRGGSYLVARKIRMFVENWDRDYLADQENVIGRAKVSGAPLSGGSEFSPPDFAKAGGDGQPVIPADAHIRLASPEHNGGIHILRRGYSFTDGIDPQAGTLLGGLFFIAFMKNTSQFVKLQTALAGDALNEYIHHTGSAVFAVPPGLRPGQHYGDALFS